MFIMSPVIDGQDK